MKCRSLVAAAVVAALAVTGGHAAAAPARAAADKLALDRVLDLSHATIVTPASLSGPERKAVAMLVDEIERRTSLRLDTAAAWPARSRHPVIAVGQAVAHKEFAGPYADKLGADMKMRFAGAEGFRIQVEGQVDGKPGSKPDPRRAVPAVIVTGNDARGVLYGVGRLLRALSMSDGHVTLPASLDVAVAPKIPRRGHMLVIDRPDNDVAALRGWETVVRDLAIFGTNIVALQPPRARPGRAPGAELATTIAIARMLDEYGLDVWLRFDPTDGGAWDKVFEAMPRLDAVLMATADAARATPAALMAAAEKHASALHRRHAKAQVWLEPPAFGERQSGELTELVARGPAWLFGVTYGPDIRASMRKLRETLPQKLAVIHVPDITRSLGARYPMPDWDLAFALLAGRTPPNPRPAGMANIFFQVHRRNLGFVALSEGFHDDLNKMIWCGLAFGEDPAELVRQYARLYIAPGLEEGVVQGVFALERNWQGPLLANDAVYTTLRQWQEIERVLAATAPRVLASSFRLQQLLLRAHLDAYTRSRLLADTAAEDRALAKLRGAVALGPEPAMAAAEAILDAAVKESPAPDWRKRVLDLALALRNSGRGPAPDAQLALLDSPLGNGPWLRERFRLARRLGSDKERLAALDETLGWSNPGPGGYYDDLGNPLAQAHLVRGPGAETDPAFLESSISGFTPRAPAPGPSSGAREGGPVADAAAAGPRSWWDHVEPPVEGPLELKYSRLDRRAHYKVRVVYTGGRGSPVRLAADGKEVHPFVDTRYRRLEFDLPPEATLDGELTLAWFRGTASGGRGGQVAEVWLMRKESLMKPPNAPH